MIAPIPCVWRNPVSPPAEAYPMGRRPSHVVSMGMGPEHEREREHEHDQVV